MSDTTEATHLARKKRHIVILGGGVGAMATAFALTDRPDWQDHYTITLYQLGWRLGGKGASGRSRAFGERIEEHGLHIWFGFYENAFRVMRRCLRALETGDLYPDPARHTDDRELLERHFERNDRITLVENIDGRWHPYELHFPRNPALPGETHALPSVAEYLQLLLRWLRQKIVDAEELLAAAAAPANAIDEVWDRLRGRLTRRGLLAPGDHPVELLDTCLHLAERPLHLAEHAEAVLDLVPDILDRVLHRVLAALEHRLADDPAIREVFVLIDLAAAAIRGIVRDDVLRRGFGVIDDRNFETWLGDNGASDLARTSTFVRAIYGLGFAFEGGDTARPAAAAGVALRGLLRLLFTYRGSPMWKMRTGMGDSIFEPLHRLLSRRGVAFEFFHRVRSVQPSATGDTIERIVIGQQVHPRQDYPYFRTVSGQPCWPDEPSYEHLEEAAALEAMRRDPTKYVNLESYWSSWGEEFETRRELVCGRDFDVVVLGISLGALPIVCPDLAARNADWQRMFERVKTTPTQAFQLWLKKTTPEISDFRTGTVLGSFVEPLDTWADMDQTLWAEAWPAGHVPRQVGYFCGALLDRPDPSGFKDPSYPRARAAEVYEHMRDYLTKDIRYLWPRAVVAGHPARLDWNLLVDPTGGAGETRLEHQFWTANIEPSNRYVLSVPGATTARLRSDRSGFANLYLAGDWTLTGLSAGCVEAAVMSGLRAARAISGVWIPITDEED
jgi:uncharacterized protein with NAD-binding domain and iron-sulfur cluster